MGSRSGATYYFFTVCVFLIAIIAPSVLNNTSANYTHLLKSLLFIPFDKNGSGHIPILFLGWTLNFEMYFYLLFAIALKINHRFRGEITAIAIVVIFFLTVNLEILPLKAYGSTIVLEFIIGIMLYKILYKRDVFGVSFLFILYASPLLFSEAVIQERGYIYGLSSCIACFLVLEFSSYYRVPRIFTILGGASYSLYLTHPYIIQVFEKIFGWFDKGIFFAVAATVFCMILTVTFAVMMYLYAENPIRKYLRNKFL